MYVCVHKRPTNINTPRHISAQLWSSGKMCVRMSVVGNVAHMYCVWQRRHGSCVLCVILAWQTEIFHYVRMKFVTTPLVNKPVSVSPQLPYSFGFASITRYIQSAATARFWLEKIPIGNCTISASYTLYCRARRGRLVLIRRRHSGLKHIHDVYRERTHAHNPTTYSNK